MIPYFFNFHDEIQPEKCKKLRGHLKLFCMHRLPRMFWENIVGQLLNAKFARVQKKKVYECYHRYNLELIVDI